MLRRKIAAARARLLEIEEQREAAALDRDQPRTVQERPGYVETIRRALGVMEVRRRRHEALDARKGHG